jgi:hypothetical protein
MSQPHDEYKRLDLPAGHIEPCPCCGADVELWQYSKSETSAATKVVMCMSGEPIGPQDGLTNEGCPMFVPPDNHYRATIREAVKYWNEFAKALQSLQRTNRWKRAQILRERP